MSTLDEMRIEVSRIMAMEKPMPEDYGRIHSLLDRRAAEIRAPFEKKIAAMKKRLHIHE